MTTLPLIEKGVPPPAGQRRKGELNSEIAPFIRQIPLGSEAKFKRKQLNSDVTITSNSLLDQLLRMTLAASASGGSYDGRPQGCTMGG